jgi:hypothetical protein
MLNQVKREELVLMDDQENQEDRVRRELPVSMGLMDHREYQDDLVV